MSFDYGWEESAPDYEKGKYVLPRKRILVHQLPTCELGVAFSWKRKFIIFNLIWWALEIQG